MGGEYFDYFSSYTSLIKPKISVICQAFSFSKKGKLWTEPAPIVNNFV